MDLQKLSLIKQEILRTPLEEKRRNDEFCGLFVDGRAISFEQIDAPLHSFRAFSQYNYPVFVFIHMSTPQEVIDKIYEKYTNIHILPIPYLNGLEKYSEWMFNQCFYLFPEHYEKILTFQDDGFLLKEGWENFVSTGNYDFIGAVWHSDIQVLCNVNTLPLRTCNGGFSFRNLVPLRKVINFVNENGGQHSFFKGLKINGEIRQRNSWLAEDAMFSSIGFSLGFFKSVTEDECNRFAKEPITFSEFKDYNNSNRPFAFHKIDE